MFGVIGRNHGYRSCRFFGNLSLAALSSTANMAAAVDETTDLSKEYDTPMGLAHTTMAALKDRIKLHYDLASEYYLSLW